MKKQIQKLNKQCLFLSGKSSQLNKEIIVKDTKIKELKETEEKGQKSLRQYRIITEEMVLLLKEKEILQKKQDKLLEQKKIVVKRINDKYSLYECFLQTEAYAKLQDHIKHNINDPINKLKIDTSLCEEILVTIQTINPLFFLQLEQLSSNKDTKDEDVLFCCLLKLNYKFKDLSNIYGLTLDAIYKKEKVIIGRMKFKERSKLIDIIKRIE